MAGLRFAFLFLILVSAGIAGASAPTDPERKKIYDHNYEWLSHFPPGFIATNMRGENDSQYPERRQAALDLLRVKGDLTTVPELISELRRASFLSADICDILGEWKARKALPLLKEVAADKKRPKEVREKAKKAIAAITMAPPEAPGPSRPAY